MRRCSFAWMEPGKRCAGCARRLRSPVSVPPGAMSMPLRLAGSRGVTPARWPIRPSRRGAARGHRTLVEPHAPRASCWTSEPPTRILHKRPQCRAGPAEGTRSTRTGSRDRCAVGIEFARAPWGNRELETTPTDLALESVAGTRPRSGRRRRRDPDATSRDTRPCGSGAGSHRPPVRIPRDTGGGVRAKRRPHTGIAGPDPRLGS